jgi:hypothetical protein
VISANLAIRGSCNQAFTLTENRPDLGSRGRNALSRYFANHIALLCCFEVDVKVTFHFDVFALVNIGHEDPVPDCANSRARQCGITGNS